MAYWDEPPSLATPCGAEEFEAAQARLTDILIGLADFRNGQTVLDVGCGFGGTLEAVGKRPDMQLIGVNIDRRQLDICRTLSVRGNSLVARRGGCLRAAVSRGAASIGSLCIEAMFHFRVAADFLHEAADVLRDGGRLVLSDILLRNPGGRVPLGAAAIESAIKREYGPWPQLWIGSEEVLEAARQPDCEPDRSRSMPPARLCRPIA